MNIKDYLKRNGMTLTLLVGMIILYLCIPSQIAENMVAKATISPRFFPTFSVLGVIVCCALLLVFDAKEHIFSHKTAEAAATQEKKEEISYVRVVLVALLLLAWYILMPRIGFIISTIVIMCIMSYLLGCRNKIVLVAFPVIFTLAVYFTFVELLHVSLPEILF
ncbi:tripartite tricarboxylate transporter TctB family protein [Intestinimonas massiliensis (ex Afouda et al. 2020)]|uniref:Tripartite tricarboxylate transporter TctB family protein n=1 Tax=Intestinimonas massiliensis (ex Afouda et al. 2020) TaxID=1673721 RepID=A0ABS9MDD2_9FIRM|nr:tripartite tricarboxylate transporter TctB family protein [Intestinimonas massiliensis (ex Afouda et al. 2020)]MCG4528628.1 tripartite tricarboxylate transporter TctB family protein [Intestinimonas massiliensis (ex Afouda et al. 2020)]